MPLPDKLRFLWRFEVFEKNAAILKDNAKYTLIFGHVLTNIMGICPENFKKFTLGHLILGTVCFLHMLTSVLFLIIVAEGVNSFAEVMLSLECIVQVSGKITVLLNNAKELNGLLQTIRYEFWPSNIINEDTDKDILDQSKHLVRLFGSQILSGIAAGTVCTVLTLTTDEKVLPYAAWYPFDWTVSPAYEILYLFHNYFNIGFGIPGVVGYDVVYFSVCSNCTAQFRLLCAVFGRIGAGDEEEIIERLSKIPGVEVPEIGRDVENWRERKLLSICIKQHQKLIRFCHDINKFFGNGHLIQIIISCVGICATCYGITVEPDFYTRTYLVLLYFCHVFELFNFCALSNELSYWGTRVSEAAYDSFWHLKKYPHVRKCLGIVMVRSQIAISMNALGLFELNYASFITVMRFTFSLYTFLTTIAEK